ncbi:MAG TPA: PilZ domain-containing protein [Deltaproteobacteria bacterium]|nr:PilZ domain-containing protein [Deltaproteobacteria bacterium]
MQEQWRNRFKEVRSMFWNTVESLAIQGVAMQQAVKGFIPGLAPTPAAANHVDDRRLMRRLRMDRTVSFWTEGMEPRQARLINLSRSGMYIETDAPLDPGRETKIMLPVLMAKNFPSVTGRVVRRAAHGMAIQLQ